MPQPILIAAGRHLHARITTRRGASPVEEFAGDELHRYLCAMAGAARGRMAWPGAHRPRIYVNDQDAARAAGIDVDALKLGAEAFHLQTQGKDLHILGNGRGVLYGAYEVLESLGCRWFAADETVVPSLERIELPAIRMTGAPAFEFRDHFSFEAWDPAWSVPNRLNGNFTAAPSYMGGHNSYGLFVHTFYALLPPEEFFDEHPEYFSLVDGVRRRTGAQICLTNPEVLRIVGERVLERMRRMPQARIFSVSQNDFHGYCTCESCARVAAEEGSQAGPLLRFVNAVAERTAREFPDKLIDTLAYEYTLKAPRQVRPGPNVRVRLCSIRCCQGHAFGACEHPGSVEFTEALRDWSKITDQMYIWHYVTNFAHYHAPMANLEELQANIRLYRKSGVRGLFMQGCGEEGGGAESAALRAYVIGRLLWNPDRPVWPLVDEFLEAYYGKAAPGVRQYLKLFHDRVRRNPSLHPSLYDSPHHPLFTDEALRSAGTILRAAEKKVSGKQHERVRRLTNGINYLELYRACGTYRRRGDTYSGEAKASHRKLAEAVIRDWRSSGITAVQENAGLNFSMERMRNRLRPHKIEWLQDGEQRIAVVPGMGGRILAWHAFGHQWLSQPEKQGPWWQVYPLHDGYEESAYLAVYFRIGWAEAYTPTWRGRELVLQADLDRNLRFERRLRFSRGVLQIVSRIQNAGDAPQNAGWAGSWRFVCPAAAALEVEEASTMQTYPAEEAVRPMVIEGPRLPLRRWRARMANYEIAHAYQMDRTHRATFARDGARLDFGLRTDERPLRPREAIVAKQTIQIRRA